MAETDPEEELYGVDLAAFTATRSAWVKRLRSEGKRDEADRVGRLKRPSLSVWALNQVVRRQPMLIDAAVEARARLRRATEQALQGDTAGLRGAQLDERRAVDAVVDEASSTLVAAGHAATDAMRLRVAETLRAAAMDETGGPRLRRGMLDHDQAAPGFGLDPGNDFVLTPAPARPARPGRATGKDGATGPDRAALRAEVHRLERRAEDLKARALAASTLADEAASEARAARQSLEQPMTGRPD